MPARERLWLAAALIVAAASLIPAAADGGPGNGKIVFWSEGRLYAVDPASGAEADLGPGTEPTWSPDGSQLAFLSGGQVSVMNADGSGRRVLHSATDSGRPVWSPDGRRLAFVSGPLNRTTLLVVDTAGGDARPVADAVIPASPPAWSPDGTRLAYAEQGSNDLAVVGADGAGKRMLTAGPLQTVDSSPAWSPDGTRIVFSRSTGSHAAGLYVVPSEGGPVRQLTRTYFYYPMSPAWAPDGTRIAFTGATLLGFTKVGPHYTTDVYVIDAEGTLERRLTLAGDFLSPTNTAPAWSPDGTRIVFQSYRGRPAGSRGVYMMNADGTCETRVGERAGQSPSWQPVPGGAAAPRLRCADLELVVGNDRMQVAAGGEERFRIDVKNLETEPATAVRLHAETPTGGSFVSATPVRGSCSLAGGSLTCELGTIAVGESILVNVAARAAGLGTFSSRAHVGANEPDGNQSNNAWELRFEALPCDLAGTWNADNMVGTRGPDTICALYGADVVRGLAGHDSLDAGPGPDRVFPGAGRDSVALRAGADFVDSRDGERDTISCGGERDLVLADRVDVTRRDCELVARPSLRCSTLGTGRANDLVGSSRNDSICALNGNDTVHAGPGSDGVDGGAGNDTLHGGPGRDLLIGGEGYDTIQAGDGERDRVRCGPQDDLVRADRIDVVAPDCERVRRL